MTRQEQEAAEQAAHEEHMQAMYDEQRSMQELTEQVEQLQSEVARLRGEVERERADVVAYLDYARTFPFTYDKIAPAIIDCLRELIEQGEHVGYHRREEGK
jgi:predicted RNase H-like nuclease (RuvC/YqgF family)